jgi:hypothetical protein
MQNAVIIYAIASQETDKHEFVVHRYSTSFEQAKATLEKISLDHLKQALGMNSNDHMESPLYDTIGVENISQGLTIRYRLEASEDGKPSRVNDRIIDMIKIERTHNFYVIPTKRRTIINTFKIIEVEAVSESGSVIVPTPEEEQYDSEN